MASPTELDIFSRSLGGDRRARTELFKKFIRDSSRVSRLGTGYSDINDFRQDTFNHLLRTGHSWEKEGGLAQWVESVAVWTALINERRRDMHARATSGEIRLCAEIEGEDATHAELLSAYAPPLRGSDDSPSTRLLSLLTEPEQVVFRKKAMENGTWEEVAAAARKPLTAVGPIFVRAATRLTRVCGAPPPMDDDLVPVFSRAAADPQKLEGRAISLRLDAAFYATTPETSRIGLTTSYDVRLIVLWNSAASAAPPDDALRRHLEQCHYCTDLLQSLVLMQQALSTSPGAPFYLCPGSFTLASAPDKVREVFDHHIAECSVCRTERSRALEGQAPIPDPAARVKSGGGMRIAWALAALLLLAVASFAGYRYFVRNNVAKSSVLPANAQLIPTVSIDPRFRDLVRDVPLQDERIMSSVLPQNRPVIKFALDQFSLGQVAQSLNVSSEVAGKGNDPGAQMIYAMCLYKTMLMTDGYREMLKSEAMAPRESLRCWVMFQFALMVGDKKIMEREAGHLSTDPNYQDSIKKVMEQVRQREQQ